MRAPEYERLWMSLTYLTLQMLAVIYVVGGFDQFVHSTRTSLTKVIDQITH